MRISDWSSDVCSSDLPRDVAAPGARGTGRGGSADRAARARPAPDARRRRLCVARRPAAAAVARSDADRAADRGGVELLRIAGAGVGSRRLPPPAGLTPRSPPRPPVPPPLSPVSLGPRPPLWGARQDPG